MSDSKFTTGAVRSSDASGFNFTDLPMVGLLALARTAGEGAAKYGRLNYLQGMPIYDLLNHSFKHMVMYNAGDRSEPHLAHAAWGLLVAIQEEVMRPEANAPHMLGPGCTITPELQAYMDSQKPILATNREAHKGEPEFFTWNLFDLQDVRKLRDQRLAVEATKAHIAATTAEDSNPVKKEKWSAVVNQTIKEYVKGREKQIASTRKPPKATLAELSDYDVDDEGFVVLPQVKPKTYPLVEATWHGSTRLVPLHLVINSQELDPDQSAPAWEKILFVSRPEDQYALMSPTYRPFVTLVIDQTQWNAAEKVIKPFEDGDDVYFGAAPTKESGNPSVDSWAKQQTTVHVEGTPTVIRTPAEAIEASKARPFVDNFNGERDGF